PDVVFYSETVAADVPETFAVPTTATVPAEVAAVALSVTVAYPTADGSLVVWPAGEAKPADAVSLSFTEGATTATSTVVVAPGVNGDVSMEATAGLVVRVDVVGWWFGARTTWQYSYNADGVRQSKTGPAGGTSRFRWDYSGGLPMLLVEEAADGWFPVRFVYGPGGRPLAVYTPLGEAVFHTDQLGSVRGVSELDGAVVATYSYDA
ncbi:MAG: hypothetical protein JJU45_07145, partial [Acidimicrobiia bacterium]|nr:hypothetical protein [Acidimicrobiia bacterium]